jgi:hypothetical protein
LAGLTTWLKQLFGRGEGDARPQAGIPIQDRKKPPDDSIRGAGVSGMVNLDVWHECGASSQPAKGFQFTLTQLTGNPAPAQPLDEVFDNLWTGESNPIADTHEPQGTPRRLRWLQSQAHSGAVAYGAKEHFGYKVRGEPDHIVTAEWLFDDNFTTMPGCTATAISTQWEGGSIELTTARAVPGAQNNRTVTFTQHSHDSPLKLKVWAVYTPQVLALNALTADGMEPFHPALLADGLNMFKNQGVPVQIKPPSNSNTIVVIGEWRDPTRPRDSSPLLVSYHGVVRPNPNVPATD